MLHLFGFHHHVCIDAPCKLSWWSLGNLGLMGSSLLGPCGNELIFSSSSSSSFCFFVVLFCFYFYFLLVLSWVTCLNDSILWWKGLIWIYQKTIDVVKLDSEDEGSWMVCLILFADLKLKNWGFIDRGTIIIKTLSWLYILRFYENRQLH